MSDIKLQVTIENLAPEQGQELAPIWIATHDGSFDTFDEGEKASPAIEFLAEDGITGLERSNVPNFDELLIENAIATGVDPLLIPQLTDALEGSRLAEDFINSSAAANGGVQETVFSPVSIPFFLAQSPGEIVTQEIVLDSSNIANNRYFSFASMIAPSNDAFIANDDPKEIEIFDEEGNFIGAEYIVTGSDVWDAGTEVNDEDPTTVPYTLADIGSGVDENGTVQLHPGLQPPGTGGIVDFEFLGESFPNADFSAPGYQVARIKVELVEEPSIEEPGTIPEILGSNEGDLLIGTPDNDLIKELEGNDLLDLGLGNDQAFGGAGADLIDGGKGADTMLGEAGNDLLLGYRGADVLIGGAGNDALFGGGGRDRFVFAPGDGTDVIFDFEVEKDAIVLRDGYDFDSLDWEYQGSGDFTTISEAESGELITTLIGVEIKDLSELDFVTI